MLGRVATVNEPIAVYSILAASTALGTWAVVDAVRTPSEDFRAIGSSRTTWLALIVTLTVLSVGVMFVLFLGVLAVAGYYLVAVRPRLHQQRY